MSSDPETVAGASAPEAEFDPVFYDDADTLSSGTQGRGLTLALIGLVGVVFVGGGAALVLTTQPDEAPVPLLEQHGYQMVEIRGGSFQMGSPASERGRRDDETQHSVTVDGFTLGVTEVPQGLWTAVTGANPSRFQICGKSCPVEQVTWMDAVKFVNTLSQMEGLGACYTIEGENVEWPSGLVCEGYRLPTEAEWEYAARAGVPTRYAGDDSIAECAWYRDNSERKSHPPARKPANAWGLHDMSGNVWEWVWDRYDRAYPPEDAANPTGAESGSGRVVRGGSWSGSATHCRVAGRAGFSPVGSFDDLGLRLARSLSKAP